MCVRWGQRALDFPGGNGRPMKKTAVYAFAVAITLTASGCFSLSWAHNRRHVRKFIDELVQLHQDIDKVIFGLDRNPAE